MSENGESSKSAAPTKGQWQSLGELIPRRMLMDRRRTSSGQSSHPSRFQNAYTHPTSYLAAHPLSTTSRCLGNGSYRLRQDIGLPYSSAPATPHLALSTCKLSGNRSGADPRASASGLESRQGYQQRDEGQRRGIEETSILGHDHWRGSS